MTRIPFRPSGAGPHTPTPSACMASTGTGLAPPASWWLMRDFALGMVLTIVLGVCVATCSVPAC